jgi:hypothetical protein
MHGAINGTIKCGIHELNLRANRHAPFQIRRCDRKKKTDDQTLSPPVLVTAHVMSAQAYCGKFGPYLR